MRTSIVPATALGLIAAAANAQNSATINTTGMELRCQLFGPCFPNQSRNSSQHPSPSGAAQFVNGAPGYSYSIDGTVTTSGVIGSIIPTGSTIPQMLDILSPGASKLARGWVRNPQGTNPTNVYIQRFDGTFAGLAVGLTLNVTLNASGTAYFDITNITIPLGSLAGTLRINSGTTNVSRWTPTDQQASEWHFNGNLNAVNGTRGKIQYLDDVSFGTILGGVGNEENQNPAAPNGITDAQSSFGTTDAFGIANIGGVVDTVYKTSPARNLADANPDLRRGVGLLVYPSTKPVFPGDIIGQWTMVWDLYIPTAAWNTEFPVALLEDSDNNDSGADLMIRRDPVRGTTIGYNIAPDAYITAPQITPNTWFRLAVVNDHPRLGTATFFVNGVSIGSTAGDWVYNFCNPNDPKYGDGTVIPAATWSSWGSMPNPWVKSAGAAPINSTFSMFADLESGRSESVYLANYLFVDRAMTSSEVSALGGPNAAGILFLNTGPTCPWQSVNCRSDYDGSSGIDGDDVIQFFADWDAAAPCSDLDESGGVDGDDVIQFFSLWDAASC